MDFSIPPLHPAEIWHGDHNTLPPLYVVTVISNPIRFNMRYQLYKEFAQRVANQGATLITVECQFGQRPWALTEEGNPNHLRLRTSAELWHKENLINLGVAHLTRVYPDWDKVAWIDADVGFTSPHWVNETVQQLQHYKVVQMFTWSQNLDPNYNPSGAQNRGFVYGWHIDGLNGLRASNGRYPYAAKMYGTKRFPGSKFHSGYAWAMRRQTWEDLGGLIDYCILGQADNLMAHAFVKQVELCIYPDGSEAYKQKTRAWQWRCDTYVNGDIGYVDGTLVHYWHGRTSLRGYWTRSKILTENDYDPNTDIVYDHQGLLKLSGNKPKLRDGIRKYFRSRDEDSTEVPGGRLIS